MEDITLKIKQDVVSDTIDHLSATVENDLVDETLATLRTKKRNVRQVKVHVRNSLIDWNLFE